MCRHEFRPYCSDGSLLDIKDEVSRVARVVSVEPFYGAGDDGEAGHTWKFDDAHFNLTPHSYTYVWDTRMIRWDSGPPEPLLQA